MKSKSPKTPAVETMRADGPAEIQSDQNDVQPELAGRPTYDGTLKSFVEHAWPTLEPVAPLQWNWHLDLICEYLTAVRDNKFRKASAKKKKASSSTSHPGP